MSLHANFSALDYVVFVGMLLVCVFIGLFFAWKDRKKQTNKDFLTGNNKLQMLPVAMSLSVSFMSTNTILGVPSEVYLVVSKLGSIVVIIKLQIKLALIGFN